MLARQQYLLRDLCIKPQNEAQARSLLLLVDWHQLVKLNMASRPQSKDTDFLYTTRPQLVVAREQKQQEKLWLRMLLLE